MKGLLTLVQSKYPAVFAAANEPFEIEFGEEPHIGQPFLFSSRYSHFCNTSDVKAIDSETGDFLLKTRNSLYKLTIIKETDNADAV